MVDKCTRVDPEINDIIDTLQGDFNVSLPGLAIGSTATAVSNVAFDFQVAGARYSKAAVAPGTAPGNDVIPQSTYGSVALDVDAAGTITVAEGIRNSAGYASADLAVAGLPEVETGKSRMGTVTVTKSDGAFTFGTTDLDAANVTTVYADGNTAFQAIGTSL